MKRILALLLALCMLFTLTACGKKKKKEKAETAAPAVVTPVPNDPFEVKLTLANFHDYFEFKEYRADVRDENTSEINSSTVAYGYQLKEQYTAANDGKHKDTMVLHFEADGVVMSGDFTVDFKDLSFSGTPATNERVPISEELHFWAKGDRTTTWAYGNYSSSNIMYLENFRATQVSGSVWLKRAEPKPSPTP